MSPTPFQQQYSDNQTEGNHFNNQCYAAILNGLLIKQHEKVSFAIDNLWPENVENGKTVIKILPRSFNMKLIEIKTIWIF